MDLLSLQGGDVLYATSDPAWGRVSQQGKTLFQYTGEIANFRDIDKKFLLSESGNQLQFSYQQFGKQPAAFNLLERRLRLHI